MNLTPQDKSELNEIMRDVAASSIPLEKPSTEPKNATPRIEMDELNQDHWVGKSHQLLSDYTYGRSLGQFGSKDQTLHVFFKRFATTFCSIISNEFQKRGTSSDSLKPHYIIFIVRDFYSRG